MLAVCLLAVAIAASPSWAVNVTHVPMSSLLDGWENTGATIIQAACGDLRMLTFRRSNVVRVAWYTQRFRLWLVVEPLDSGRSRVWKDADGDGYSDGAPRTAKLSYDVCDDYKGVLP